MAEIAEVAEIAESQPMPPVEPHREVNLAVKPNSDVEMVMEEFQAPENVETHEAVEKERRKKKKRRKDREEDTSGEVGDHVITEEPAVQDKPIPPVEDGMPIDPIDAMDVPDEYLPSFPTPFQPPKPSKSEIALQGLDKAIVDAEIVNPAITESLGEDKKEHDGASAGRLSPRMLKRLQDLGITELFAGWWHSRHVNGFTDMFGFIA